MIGEEAFASVLAAAQQGAAWALARLWEDLGPLVAGYLRLQGAQEPDDLASETFIGVFQGIGRFRGDERRFRSWVLVIAHRRLLDERRQRARRPAVVADDRDLHKVMGGDAEVDSLARLADGEVLGLFGELSEDQRTVMVLRIVGQLTIEEVAEVVGKRPGAVKALQRRALEQLRKKLSTEGVPL